MNMNDEPHRSKPVKRKVYIWSKANSTLIDVEMNAFHEQFMEQYNEGSSTDEMWESFKSNFKQTI